jgi:hypothetical protein
MLERSRIQEVFTLSLRGCVGVAFASALRTCGTLCVFDEKLRVDSEGRKFYCVS